MQSRNRAGLDHRGCADAFYRTTPNTPRRRYSAARFSFLIALAGLVAVACASAGLVLMVRRRVCERSSTSPPRLSRLASGDVSGEIAGATATTRSARWRPPSGIPRTT